MNLVYKRRRNKLWSEHEERTLIDMWAQKLPDLTGDRKNTHVYEEMRVDLLNLHNIEVNINGIKSKLEILRRKFAIENAKVDPSGVFQSAWVHYRKMAAIMGVELRKKNNNFSSAYVEECAGSKFDDEAQGSSGDELVVETIMSCEGSENLDETPPLTQSEIFNTPSEDDKSLQPEHVLFSQLVTTELYGLDEDLRVDAQRKIYNIICDTKMMQFKRKRSK